MVFNWLRKDTGMSEQEMKEEICKDMLEKSNELMRQSHFLRMTSRSLRFEITNTMVSNASAQNPDIEKKLNDIKSKIESTRKMASMIRQSPNDVTGEFTTISGISKEIKNLSQEITCFGSRTERKLYADCPNNRTFVENLKENLNEGMENFCPPVPLSDTPEDKMYVEVSKRLAGVTLKRLSEKYINNRIDRYKKVFASPDFFLHIPEELKEGFQNVDRQQVKVPQRTVAPLPRYERANESEIKKTEEAMRRITESEAAVLKEIGELMSRKDVPGLPRKEIIARDQRLVVLESAMKEKREQLKKADERLERMRWKNDHLDESNTKVNEQNADVIERFCTEIENDLQQLALTYEAKCKALDELITQLAAKIKGSKPRGLIQLVKVKETIRKLHERDRPGDDINKYKRLKMLLEAKTVKELETVYESMEGERITKFSQAMVLKSACKAGGIEELIGYCAEDAVVDVLKAHSPGVPKKAIKAYIRTNPPPEIHPKLNTKD